MTDLCGSYSFYVAETTLAYSVGRVARGLANGGMTDQQRATLGSNDPEYRLRCGVIGSQIQIAGWTTYGTMLWLYKSCVSARTIGGGDGHGDTGVGHGRHLPQSVNPRSTKLTVTVTSRAAGGQWH
ncbi:hypothetical protein NHJ13051_002044 [Beauveria bassiana]